MAWPMRRVGYFACRLCLKGLMIRMVVLSNEEELRLGLEHRDGIKKAPFSQAATHATTLSWSGHYLQRHAVLLPGRTTPNPKT